MQTIFNALVNSFIDQQVGISEHFLGPALADALKANLLALYAGDGMHSVGTGRQHVMVHGQLFRSDKIHWLDAGHHNKVEDEFFLLMDAFVYYLNRTCYAGITGYEFHYTMYEAGSFYKTHIDQFHHDKGRAYSMIMYLNDDWQRGDGGELCIHHAASDQIIAPTQRKRVFFKSSELPHEVLLTHKPRMSITGWLKNN